MSTGIYGFTLSSTTLTSRPGWIAVPLLLQFLIAATSNALFAINQTLLSDLCPGKGASSTAINNLVRCGLSAVGVAFIEQMIAFGASTVVYVSCNVHTQARDIGQMLQRSEAQAKEEGGKKYVLESLRGLDLFPQTAHVEAIAVMRLV